MSTDLPIACSLDATELRERLAKMAALGHETLVQVDDEGSRVRLRFAARPGIEARLEQIVAEERRCCPFLTMHIAVGGGAATLQVEAPQGAEGILSELVAAFRGQTGSPD